jgi:lipooligosaccharide transport system permease protein
MSTLPATGLDERGPGWPRWFRALWYHGAFYAQTWRASVISSFLFPLLYLTSLGIGVGRLVSRHSGLIQGHTYLHFIAPGLLAITAMQVAAGESMWAILGAVKWVRTYHAAVATPLEPEDVVTGKLAWVGLRLVVTAGVYSVIIAFFGAITSWWGLALPLVGLLTGWAFAAPLIAYAVTANSDAPFTMIFRFLIIPMSLFSATFYPVSAYPPSLRWIVQIMPLYHGVALTRTLAYGHGAVGPTVAHVAVLVALAGVGFVVARRNMRRRLVD